MSVNRVRSAITHGSQFAVGMGLALLASLPAKAAETIYFDYGYLSRSLPVSAVETFAHTGEVSRFF